MPETSCNGDKKFRRIKMSKKIASTKIASTIEEAIEHSDRCLLSISEFITELNVQHKGGNGIRA